MVNRRDYRAWYGLGQAYEILKMNHYSLYYFKIAHKLRPYDSRMLVALGETYEKLDRFENAIQCYSKACDVGDIEGIAMYKMANLHEKLGSIELAVKCYIMYCSDERAAADKQSLYHGYMTLANYYEGKEEYDRASHYAYKCLESDDRKSEAKSLLKTIENKRKILISSNVGTNAAGNTNNAANADTSSDGDMDMELSDLKFNEYLNSQTSMCGIGANDTSVSFKTSTNTTNEVCTSTNQSILDIRQIKMNSVIADDMSLSESDMTTNTSVAATNTPLNILSRRTLATTTNRSQNIVEGEEDDEDTHSMEMSSISID